VTPGSAGKGRDQAPILFYAILARIKQPRHGAFGARDLSCQKMDLYSIKAPAVIG
jgi:hypothetical protein